MAVIKRVDVGSAFKVGLVVYAFLGFFIGLIVAGLSLIAGSLGSLAGGGGGIVGPRGFGAGFGFLSIIIFPILYGVIGGVVLSIVAAIYNLAAGWVGGLQVDVE